MIKEFKNIDEFDSFIYDKSFNNEIGFGGEGDCYLGKDDLVYKVIIPDYIDIYDVDNIIKKSDYDLKHFAFPIDIYTDKNHQLLYGYSCEYFKNDIFGLILENDYFDFNLVSLLNSYYEVIEEIKILSNDNIFLYDIVNNVLFNNEDLMVIDTLGYVKKTSATLDKNISMFLQSIERAFYFFFDGDETFNNEKSIEEVIYNVKKRVKKYK